MDPNACLSEIRELGNQIHNGDMRESVIEDYANAVDALDEWITKGGFLPVGWNKQTLIWTLEDEDLRDLAADATGARRFRISVDWGTLKWKRNEDGWTAGIEPDKREG